MVTLLLTNTSNTRLVGHRFSDDLCFCDLKGKCGICEFKSVFGGGRARAVEATGDFPAEEPLCSYQPRAFKKREKRK